MIEFSLRELLQDPAYQYDPKTGNYYRVYKISERVEIITELEAKEILHRN